MKKRNRAGKLVIIVVHCISRSCRSSVLLFFPPPIVLIHAVNSFYLRRTTLVLVHVYLLVAIPRLPGEIACEVLFRGSGKEARQMFLWLLIDIRPTSNKKSRMKKKGNFPVNIAKVYTYSGSSSSSVAQWEIEKEAS